MSFDWVCPILGQLWPHILSFLHFDERLTLGATCTALTLPSRSFTFLDVSYLGSLYTLAVIDRQYGVSGLVDPSEYHAIVEHPLHARLFTVMQSHEGHLACTMQILPASNLQAQRLAKKGLLPTFMRIFALAQIRDAQVLTHGESAAATVQIADAAASVWLSAPQFASRLSEIIKLSSGTLKVFIAVDCHIDAAWLGRMAMWLPALSSLNIASTVQRRVNSGSFTLASVLVKHYPFLEELNISGADVAVDEIAEVLSGLTRLRSFAADASAPCGASWYHNAVCSGNMFYGCNWLFRTPSAGANPRNLQTLSLLNVAQGFLHELLPAACETCPWLQEVAVGYLPRKKNIIEAVGASAHLIYPCPGTGTDTARLDINPAVLHSCNCMVANVPRLFGNVLIDVRADHADRAWDERDAFDASQPELFAQIQERYMNTCRQVGAKRSLCSRDSDWGYVSPATLLWHTCWLRIATSPGAGSLQRLIIEGRAPINDDMIELLAMSMPKLQELQVEGLKEEDFYFTAHEYFGILKHAPCADFDDVSSEGRTAANRILMARK